MSPRKFACAYLSCSVLHELVLSCLRSSPFYSAYRLGSIIRRQGPIGDSAMECLISCMVNAKECVRRAATWGIGSGGHRVVPALLRLLQDPPVLLPPIMRQAIRTNAGYALRVAFSGDVQTVDPRAVDTLEAAISACEVQLAQRVAQLSPQEREVLELSHNRGARGWDGNMYSCVLEMDHEVHELRKTIATCLLALGQLGRIGMDHDCAANCLAPQNFPMLSASLCLWPITAPAECDLLHLSLVNVISLIFLSECPH
eukprot:SAG31_NODE_1152_length_9642_cov_4.124489_3_plen_257_part_00